MRRSLYLSLLVPLLGSNIALAKEIQREYLSAYHLGMGNAGMAGARGADAMFMNPAGISEVKGILNEIDVLAPTAIVSTNSKNLISEAQKGSSATSSGGGGGIDAAMAQAQKLQEKPQGAMIQNFSGVVFRRAGFGLLNSAKVNALIGSDMLGLPTINAGVVVRNNVAFTAARGFWNEAVMLGVTYQYKIKGERTISYSALELQRNLDKIKSEFSGGMKCGGVIYCGTANGFDLGMVYKADKTDLKPRFGLVVHNIGDTSYTKTSKSGKAPSADLQSVDASIGFEPSTKRSGMRFFVDYRDLLNRQKENAYKRVHLGGDISFQGIIGVMGGMNQGWPTYGAFLNLKFVRIEGGIYTEEVGTYASELGDKRYFGRMLIGWAQ